MESIIVTNPYTGAEVGRVPCGTAEDIDRAVQKAADGATAMRKMSLCARAGILEATARILQARWDVMARLITSETGKTIREAGAEVARAANIFLLAAEETRRLHGETIPFDALAGGAERMGFWMREPIGIVGAITPWNVPLALTAHKIAPALGAGNAVIHKPAEQSPLNALVLADIMKEARLPDGALTVVTGLGEEAGDALVRHPDVGFVSFTGSREVGMQLPGRAGYKRVALELGGNSPVIVTESANLETAAYGIIHGGFAVAGQLCISVQRVIVHESVHETLLGKLVAKVAELKVGDPADNYTDVGTLISSHACNRVAEAVRAAQRAGAKVHIGGQMKGPTQYAPTILTGLSPEDPLAYEEAFAPLVILMPYATFDEAISLANNTPYGLNAGIYTNDLEEALGAAHHLEVGTVMINDVPTFRSDLMPYGGRKQSGLGREGVRFTMEEMTELKVVCFNEFKPKVYHTCQGRGKGA